MLDIHSDPHHLESHVEFAKPKPAVKADEIYFNTILFTFQKVWIDYIYTSIGIFFHLKAPAKCLLVERLQRSALNEINDTI